MTRAGQAPRLSTCSPIPNPQSLIPSGFTLIELMVVITIIAILMTLVLQVAGGLISGARESATKATISKIQAILNSRAQAFERLSMRKGYLTGCQDYQTAQTNYSTAPASTRTIIAMKLLQLRFFPQTYAETTPYTPPLQPNIVANPDALNAEVLYDSLTQANMLGDTVVGTDTFSTAEVAYRKTANGNTLGSFVDAWGNPIRFYRWPTRLFRSGGQTAASGAGAVAPISATDTQNVKLLFSTLPVFTGNLGPDTSSLYNTDLDRDPDDPLRECQYNVTNFETSFHTPATFHVFLVISAGPDGVLGLYEPEDKANYGHLGAVKKQADWPSPNDNPLSDDIISLNIRAGGK